MDKNQAIIDYLIQCPYIQNSPLYFNLVNARNDDVQIITSSEDVTTRTPYIDGSIPKKYTFTLITFKSITDMAVVKDSQHVNENVDDLADVQSLLDWIHEQEDAHNYPDFGDDCYIDDIQTTTDEPQFDGINDELTPPLAMYSISIIVNYIDTHKVLWKEN